MGKQMEFKGDTIKLERQTLNNDWKQTWKRVKTCFKKGIEGRRIEVYRQKEMQSEIYRKQDQTCNLWLEQKLSPKKTAAIISMLEQMVETKAWKVTRRLSECNKCRLCAVEQLLAGCKVLTNSEYGQDITERQ